MEDSVFLTSLDCIFDTRLGVLYQKDLDLVSKAIKGNYNDRIIDSFPGLRFNDFKKLYDGRDKSVLVHAIRTPIVDMIKDFAFKSLQMGITTPFDMNPKIYLNIYPYELSETQINNIIRPLVMLTHGAVEVKAIHLPVDDLTPGYLKSENVSIFTQYNFTEWLDTHSKSKVFLNDTCPQITMLSPTMVFKELTQTEVSKFKSGAFDPFTQLEEEIKIIVNLKFLDTSMFNFVSN